MGYQPERKTPESQEIKGLVKDIPLSIGLVISNITNPFFTELARVIEEVAGQYGYNIVLCNTQGNLEKESEVLEILSRRRVSGLIIAPVDVQRSNVQEFVQPGIPIVFIDRYKVINVGPPDLAITLQQGGVDAVAIWEAL